MAHTEGQAKAAEFGETFAELRESITTAHHDHEELRVVAPFTGAEVGRIPQCGRADVERAVARARAAQNAWAGRSARERARVVLAFHDLVLDRRETLMDVMQLESGKARRDAFEEVLDVANTARHYAHRTRGYLKPERVKGALPFLTRTEVHRDPMGVVGLIAPWNYPLTLAVSDAIPALLAGNAVVLKPAEQTPFTALLAKRLLAEAGLPDDCFQVVTGHGQPIGEPLVEGVNFVGFTGSTAVGKVIGELAGRHLVKASLELGGKNPMLVLDDADVDRAVDGAVRGCFANAGQLCISFERLYVHEAVFEEFRRELVDATAALSVGARFDFDAEMGSLVSQAQLEKVESHVDDAVERGATVDVGGSARPDLGPYFYEPTVLSDVPADATVACEETFGPVVRLERVPNVATAVERANDSAYGLNASVWTADTSRGRTVARRIECGSVNVNDAYAAMWGSVGAPMGGKKQSGLGRRHGREGFLKYTSAKTISTQRLRPVMEPPGEMSYGAFADRMSQVLSVMKRIPGLR